MNKGIKPGPLSTGLRVASWHFVISLLLPFIVLAGGKSGTAVSTVLVILITFPVITPFIAAHYFAPDVLILSGISILCTVVLNSMIWGIVANRIHHTILKRKKLHNKSFNRANLSSAQC